MGHLTIPGHLKISHVSLLYLCLLFSWCSLQAQHSISFDLNFNKDAMQLQDNGGQLRAPLHKNVSFGLSYRYLLKRRIAISTGIALKGFDQSVSFKSFPYFSAGMGTQAIQVPLLLGYRLAFGPQRRFAVTPLAGFTFNWPLAGSVSNNDGIFRGGNQSMYFQSSYRLQQTTSFSAGLLLEIRMRRRISLGITAQYNYGSQPLSRENILYGSAYAPGPVYQAQLTTHGTYWTYLGVKLIYSFGKSGKRQGRGGGRRR